MKKKNHIVYYLRSILVHMKEYQSLQIEAIITSGYGIGHEALADNINWLDCYIEELRNDRRTKSLSKM